MSGPAIIIDNGSGVCKAGFSNEDVPRVEMPSIVGNIRGNQLNECLVGLNYKDSYVGSDAMTKRGILELHSPIKHGIINNWDIMEKIWNHVIYQELRVAPEEYPFLLTEAPLNPKYNREKMTEIMFEKINVPALYISIQALLALYASGRTTGLVVDSGDGVTYSVPIFEGYPFPASVRRLDVAGRDLTQYLQRILRERNYAFVTTAEVEIIREMKEKLCYVAYNYEEELNKAHTTTAIEDNYVLPDGQVVTINDERFRCTEVLFDPSMIGMEGPGIDQCVVESIKTSSFHVRKDLASNILLCGGTTLHTGFGERLKKDVQSYFQEMEVKVNAPPERKYLIWQGAAVLAEHEEFKDMWITHEEYMESGAGIVHRKCI